MPCAPKKLAKVVQFYSGCMYLGGALLYSDFSIKLDCLGQHVELAVGLNLLGNSALFAIFRGFSSIMIII